MQATPDPRRWRVLAACCLLTLAVLTVPSMSLAWEPATPRLFGANDLAFRLSTTLPALLLAAIALAGGVIADLTGRRRVLLVGVALFLAGGLVSVLARTDFWVVAGRLTMAVGGGLCAPLAMALTRVAFPPGEQARALGIFTAVQGTALVGGSCRLGRGDGRHPGADRRKSGPGDRRRGAARRQQRRPGRTAPRPRSRRSAGGGGDRRAGADRRVRRPWRVDGNRRPRACRTRAQLCRGLRERVCGGDARHRPGLRLDGYAALGRAAARRRNAAGRARHSRARTVDGRLRGLRLVYPTRLTGDPSRSPPPGACCGRACRSPKRRPGARRR